MKIVTLILSLTVGVACGYLMGTCWVQPQAPVTIPLTSPVWIRRWPTGQAAAAAKSKELWQDFARRKGQRAPAA